jgi:hypothetical protein
MSDELHVVADFGRQLRALPEPAHRRRAPIAALAVVVLAAVAGALAVATRDTPDAVAVERHGNVTTIRVLDARADPARLTEELRRKGVNATIRTRPVKPQWVGAWVGVIYNARDPQGRHVRIPGFHVGGDVVSFRSPLPVDLVLELGVPGG